MAGAAKKVSQLNPNAREWNPSVDSPEENRCLYITFSNGYPLTAYQIYWFFTGMIGPYVEKVDINQPRGGFPLFGRVIFQFSYIPLVILNGQETMQFSIDGKTMWCKKFCSKNNREV